MVEVNGRSAVSPDGKWRATSGFWRTMDPDIARPT